MLFREASIQGQLVNIRAADDLGQYVNLISGRLPTVCVPDALRGASPAGKRADPVYAGPSPDRGWARKTEGRCAVRDVRPAVARNADGGRGASLPHAAAFTCRDRERGCRSLAKPGRWGRSSAPYAWFIPVERGDVHPWSIDAFQHKVEQLTAQVGTAVRRRPGRQHRRSNSRPPRARRTPPRAASCSSAATAALCCSHSRSSRPQHCDATRQMPGAGSRLHGARRWQVELFTFRRVAGPCRRRNHSSAGSVGGAVAATVCLACRLTGRSSRRARTPVRIAGIAPRLLGVALVAALLLYGAVRSADRWRWDGSALTPLDLAAIGALGRRSAPAGPGARSGAGDLQGGGTSAFLLLVPALIVFAAAVIAARLLVPVLRGLGRAGRRGADLGAARDRVAHRNPGHAAIAATFLVASLGLALFAAALPLDPAEGDSTTRPPMRFRRRSSSVRICRSWYRCSTAAPGSRAYPGPGLAPSVAAVPATSRRAWRSRSSASTRPRCARSAAGAPTSRRRRCRNSRRASTPTSSVRSADDLAPPAGSELTLPVTVKGRRRAVRAGVPLPAGRLPASVSLGRTTAPTHGGPCTAASLSRTRRWRRSSSTS